MQNFVKKLLDAVVKKATENGKLDKLVDSLADALLEYVIEMLKDEIKPVESKTTDTKPAETVAKTTTPEPQKPVG